MSCLYAMQDAAGFVKFGIANNPHARMKELQTGNASELSLIGYHEIKASETVISALEHEKLLHQCLKALKVWVRGEWFAPCAALTIVLNAFLEHEDNAAMEAARLAELFWAKP